MSDFDCIELNHKDRHQSERIRDLFFDSYTVEAELIGVSDFPPLRRTADDICSAQSIFLGCMSEDCLVAVAEIEKSNDGSANIAGFAVDPSYFRQGIGSRLMCHLESILGDSPMTVSTARNNQPAISLYEGHEFRVASRWATECGIDMVTLLRPGEGHTAEFSRSSRTPGVTR